MTTIGDGNEAASPRVARVAPAREEPTASGRRHLAVAAAAARLLPSPVTVRARFTKARALLSDASERSRSVSVWTAVPPSLAALAAYTAAGDWVPGERAPVLEFLGRAYGYVLVLPVTAVAYSALWLLARPLRLAIALVLTFALWIVW